MEQNNLSQYELSALYALIALQIKQQIDPFSYARSTDLSTKNVNDNILILLEKLKNKEATTYYNQIQNSDSVENSRVRFDMLRSIYSSVKERSFFFGSTGYERNEEDLVQDEESPHHQTIDKSNKKINESESLAITALMRYFPQHKIIKEAKMLNYRVDAILMPINDDFDLPIIFIEYKQILTKNTIETENIKSKQLNKVFEKESFHVLLYSSISAKRILEELSDKIFPIRYDERNDRINLEELNRLVEKIY
ncbi:hypothetical protein [Leptospira vanthielii]|uniref:DUF2726 domain-containing protein n=1 Tax=Leptospira vanthielii TaxID=293085 RepID=A0ABY2NUV2_9LEPT|nr:hypothetical protein [Leptospira vanthielii]TGM61733.1 hypothetical protein EHQ95_00345 [Leptospira vanthielii]